MNHDLRAVVRRRPAPRHEHGGAGKHGAPVTRGPERSGAGGMGTTRGPLR